MKTIDEGNAGKPTKARKVSRGRPRSSEADSAILQAALDLFVERGMDGVGIEQVAGRAGVARTTVYRRWSSKESILAEAMARSRGAADEEVLRKPLSPQGTVTGVVEALAETVSAPRYRQMVARLIGSIPDQPALMATYLKNYLLPRRKIAADAIELARAEGQIRNEVNVDIVLDLIAGAIMYRLFLYPGAHSEKEMRTYLRRVLEELRLEASK